MTLKRTVIVVGSAIAALLVVVIVIGALILNSLNSPATEEERVAACMEQQGYPLDKPANEIEGFTMDGLREASKACGLD
jgi:hypothetical protein